MRKYRIAESRLRNMIRESVRRALSEAESHLDKWERNGTAYRDRLFNMAKQSIERNLKKAGLNLPFAVRNYADWNMAVDIPISAIKSFSKELVDMYDKDLTAANEKPRVGGREASIYDKGFVGMSRLYGDDYENGGFNDDYVRTDSDMYNKLKQDPNTRWSNRAPMDGIARYYRYHMPDKRKEYDALRQEVLEIKSIIESAGYTVEISNKNFWGYWDDENETKPSYQNFVRFILYSEELDRYRNEQYRTPEHRADFEAENAGERRAEQYYEDAWIRRNFG